MEYKKINPTVVEGRKFKNANNVRLLVGLRQTDLPFRRATPIDNRFEDINENRYN